MKIIEVVLSTTHIDRHNEMMSVGALESMVQQVKTNIIPMGVEHDPRIPPIGRIIDAKLRKREDGEHEVVGIVEIFEDGDEIPFSERRLPDRKPDTEKINLIYDRSYRSEQDQIIINNIAKILDSSPKEESKKSFDVLSVLAIVGAFTAGAISSGFFNSLGADAYELLKGNIKKLLGRKGKETDERLFKFNPTIEINDRIVDVEVIMTNPSESDIDSFFDEGIKELDTVVMDYIKDKSVKKIVFEYENKKINIRFGVRIDGVPMFPKDSNS